MTQLTPHPDHRPALLATFTAISLAWLLLLALTLPCRAAQPPLTPAQAARAMLENIRDNGLNPDPAINNGLGGLWINWRPGSRPRQVNLNGSGAPDSDTPGAKTRHDVLTDLRYLHNLYLYKQLFPADTRFDADLTRFRKIAALEWTDSHNERGWVYDELASMARASGDSFFRDAARKLAESYATAMAKPPAGIFFKTSKDHPRGYYRVDLDLEIGCALVQAGAEFKRPEWIAQGKQMVRFVYDHAYIASRHVFPRMMDEVLLPGGGVNPDEKFYDAKNSQGGQVRMGETGQMIASLMHAYAASGERDFLDKAIDLLEPMRPETNPLGLWDAEHLGYFSGVWFTGSGQRDPGDVVRKKTTKECGRQLHMLEAVMLVNAATGGRFQAMEDQIMKVALEKAYDPALRGIVYEKEADWSARKMKNGTMGDWVTTEAMGIASQVLLKWELHKAGKRTEH